MSLTIESLTQQMQVLEQQKQAAFNAFQQCLGAIGVIQNQIAELKKANEQALKEKHENGQAVEQAEEQTA